MICNITQLCSELPSARIPEAGRSVKVSSWNCIFDACMLLPMSWTSAGAGTSYHWIPALGPTGLQVGLCLTVLAHLSRPV